MNTTSTIQKVLYGSKLFLKKHSPVILTCIASIGVVATAVTAVKATPKALELIKSDSQENHDGDPYGYTKTEAIISAWKCYVPSIVIGASTIVCMFGANALNQRKQTALMSAYALISSSYQEYKTKLKELYGEETHNTIVDSIVKDKCEKVHITADDFIRNTTLDYEDETNPEITRTFYDYFSERYFESTISRVIQAEYHLNRNFMLSGAVSLNNFYDFLGLEKTDIGDAVGWSCINGDIYWIDFDHRKTVLENGMEIFIIDMVYGPTSEWMEDL